MRWIRAGGQAARSGRTLNRSRKGRSKWKKYLWWEICVLHQERLLFILQFLLNLPELSHRSLGKGGLTTFGPIHKLTSGCAYLSTFSTRGGGRRLWMGDGKREREGAGMVVLWTNLAQDSKLRKSFHRLEHSISASINSSRILVFAS